MNWPRLAGALLALSLHVSLFYAFVTHSGPDSLADGRGSDNFTVVATISLESGDLFTQEATKASVDSVAANAKPPEPPKEEKPKETEKSTESSEKANEALPPIEAEKAPALPPIEKSQPMTQTASVAAAPLEAQQAAAALAARRSRLWTAYEIELHSALERHKVKPHAAKVGVVLVQITIAPSGEIVSRSVLKSSGFSELDKAAIASLERASPFPPIPPEVSLNPLTLTVPFQYQTR